MSGLVNIAWRFLVSHGAEKCICNSKNSYVLHELRMEVCSRHCEDMVLLRRLDARIKERLLEEIR